ncbi:hypothetical protein KY284_021210 [Solanum tuberosum]|nr:hypothetical protein KY284_021210 [Solanum tuberosum]
MVVAYIMLIVPQISDAMESPCLSGSVPLPLRRVMEPAIGRFRFLEVAGHSVKQAKMSSAPAPCSLLPAPSSSSSFGISNSCHFSPPQAAVYWKSSVQNLLLNPNKLKSVR